MSAELAILRRELNLLWEEVSVLRARVDEQDNLLRKVPEWVFEV